LHSSRLVADARLNAQVKEDTVEVAPEVNLGLAVSIDEGVIVPVIRNADGKSMAAVVAPTVVLTLVFDHRAVDGHPRRTVPRRRSGPARTRRAVTLASSRDSEWTL
jgi:pyruvate/2-oxoglutarate dehydrogenase complex dihydrolipoamide acyltransferase (E2) component